MCMATKPILRSLKKNEQGGISLDKFDTAALLIYINDLQRCAGMK